MPCLFQHIVSFGIVSLSLSPRRCSSIASPSAPASSLRWRQHVTVSRRNMRPSMRVPELAELRFQCRWFPRVRRQTSCYFPEAGVSLFPNAKAMFDWICYDELELLLLLAGRFMDSFSLATICCNHLLQKRRAASTRPPCFMFLRIILIMRQRMAMGW